MGEFNNFSAIQNHTQLEGFLFEYVRSKLTLSAYNTHEGLHEALLPPS